MGHSAHILQPSGSQCLLFKQDGTEHTEDKAEMLRQAQHQGAHHWAAVSSNSVNRKSLEVPEDMNRRAKMPTQIANLLPPTLGLFCSKCIGGKRMLNIHIFKMVPRSLVCHGDRINQSSHFRASFTASLCLAWGPLGPCAFLHGVTFWLCCLHLSARCLHSWVLQSRCLSKCFA